jgi:hypothetical protein
MGPPAGALGKRMPRRPASFVPHRPRLSASPVQTEAAAPLFPMRKAPPIPSQVPAEARWASIPSARLDEATRLSCQDADGICAPAPDLKGRQEGRSVVAGGRAANGLSTSAVGMSRSCCLPSKPTSCRLRPRPAGAHTDAYRPRRRSRGVLEKYERRFAFGLSRRASSSSLSGPTVRLTVSRHGPERSTTDAILRPCGDAAVTEYECRSACATWLVCHNALCQSKTACIGWNGCS